MFEYCVPPSRLPLIFVYLSLLKSVFLLCGLMIFWNTYSVCSILSILNLWIIVFVQVGVVFATISSNTVSFQFFTLFLVYPLHICYTISFWLYSCPLHILLSLCASIWIFSVVFRFTNFALSSLVLYALI